MWWVDIDECVYVNVGVFEMGLNVNVWQVSSKIQVHIEKKEEREKGEETRSYCVCGPDTKENTSTDWAALEK